MLSELIDSEVINLDVECINWMDAIKKGTELLLNKDYIEKSYEEAIIDNFIKLGPYMVIAPGIVLSHARHEQGVKRLSLSIITLKNPVNFGSEMNDPVKLIITLAAIDDKSHMKALEELMGLFMNTEDLNSLMMEKDKEKILMLLNKYSNKAM
jgi:PTS system ascorbate-specific IIA component